MKIFKRLVTVILSVSIAMSLLVLPTSAAVVQWDGKSELAANRTYIITEEVKLKKAITIPEGTKLSVKKGGSLLIYKKGSIEVEGNLAVAIGGSITNSGRIDVESGAQLNIYGEFLSTISGKLNVKGNMTVYNNGVAKISSTVKLYKTASVYNKGSLAFLNSSDVTSSAPIESIKGSTLRIQGLMTNTVSGTIKIYGYLAVGRNAKLKTSGYVYLDKDSTFNRFGKVTVTKSGTFEDNRPESLFEKMTVSILVDEPDVISRGIDVSYAQKDIDWKRVADSGVDFALIRIARGDTGTKPQKVDDYFEQNIKGATENGIDVGVYFYSYATSVNESRKEGEFLVEILAKYPNMITYPVILDMEEEEQRNYTASKLTNMIEAFFKPVMEAGYYPMLYSYKYWLETGLDMRILDKYAIWLAQIDDEVTYDGGYYIWQYSFTGRVSGIDCDVDLNLSYRDFPTILRKHGLNHLR